MRPRYHIPGLLFRILNKMYSHRLLFWSWTLRTHDITLKRINGTSFTYLFCEPFETRYGFCFLTCRRPLMGYSIENVPIQNTTAVILDCSNRPIEHCSPLKLGDPNILFLCLRIYMFIYSFIYLFSYWNFMCVSFLLIYLFILQIEI